MLADVDARIQVLQASISAALPRDFVPAPMPTRHIPYRRAVIAPVAGSSRRRDSASPNPASESRTSRTDRLIEREQRLDLQRAAELYAAARAASRPPRQLNIDAVLNVHHPASAMNRTHALARRTRAVAVVRPDPATVTKTGWRRPRAKSLSQSDLWQRGVGPDDQSHSHGNDHHMCGICRFVKSHPVSFVSFC
jgi:hypothetical protein